MKYGYIDPYSMQVAARLPYNLGNGMQIASIKHLYDIMKIKEDDLLKLDIHDLKTYRGEYVILPVNEVYSFYSFPFSEYIIPVFLGISFVDSDPDIDDDTIACFKRFSPIGCRDEATLQIMRKYNVPAYLGGCLTIIFDKRSDVPENGKTFFIDVPPSLKKNIPEKLKNNSVFISHVYRDVPDEDSFDPDLSIWAKQRLEKYKKEAALVISARMHAIAPCMAAGIPVICVLTGFHQKMKWIDKFIPIYTPDTFEHIDWNPDPVNIEAEKRMVIDSAIFRIQQVYKKYAPLYDVSWFYEDIDRSNYSISGFSYPDKAIEYIKANWDKECFISYSFWGITGTSNSLYEFIQKNYPKAFLKNVYNLKDVLFNGIHSLPPDKIVSDDSFLFVTSDTACFYAADLLQKSGRKEKDYFLCYNVFLEKEDL
jgi:hypothetical protein